MSCHLASNLTVAGTCSNHGVCSGSLATGCVCSPGYDPSTYCNATNTANLHYVDIIFKVPFLIGFLLLVILNLLEIIIDLRLNQYSRFSLKRPVFLVKFLLLGICTCRSVREALEIYDSSHRQTNLMETTSIVIILGLLFMYPIYPLMVVNWITILIHAKSLKASNRNLNRFRMISGLLTLATMPVMIVLSLMNRFNYFQPWSGIGVALLGTAILITMFIGSTFYLIKLFRWLSSPHTRNYKSVQLAQRQAYLICIINLMVLIGLVNIGVNLSIPPECHDGVTVFLLDDVVGTLTTFIPVLCYFFLSQRYCTSAERIGLGYYYGMTMNKAYLDILNEMTSSTASPYAYSQERTPPMPDVSSTMISPDHTGNNGADANNDPKDTSSTTSTYASRNEPTSITIANPSEPLRLVLNDKNQPPSEESFKMKSSRSEDDETETVHHGPV